MDPPYDVVTQNVNFEKFCYFLVFSFSKNNDGNFSAII